jgi:hypothetical protein
MNLILFTMNNLNNNLSVVKSEATTRFNTQSIIDLPQSSFANANANANANFQTNVLPEGNLVDAEVQAKSFWKLFKNSLKKFFCINDSDIPVNDVISELSESNVQELTNTYNIMDEFNYGQAFSQTDATFYHVLIDGINQYYICYSDTFLSVNPDLINNFI